MMPMASVAAAATSAFSQSPRAAQKPWIWSSYRLYTQRLPNGFLSSTSLHASSGSSLVDSRQAGQLRLSVKAGVGRGGAGVCWCGGGGEGVYPNRTHAEQTLCNYQSQSAHLTAPPPSLCGGQGKGEERGGRRGKGEEKGRRGGAGGVSREQQAARAKQHSIMTYL